MTLKPLALAVTAASQRELFFAPAPQTVGGPQMFLAPAQHALVTPSAAYPVDVAAPEQAYVPITDFVEDGGSTSWLAFSGAFVLAAVAGIAIGRAGTTARVTPADQLDEASVEQELQAVATAKHRLAMLALMGENMVAVRGQERCGAVRMGFGPNEKDLSNDPSIEEVLRVAKVEQAARFATASTLKYAKSLPGVTEPLGFFDPLGFCSDKEISLGKIRFYREVELKHGRVGMLAALGFVVGENFHPLFGGDIDVPAYLAFQQTPLQKFWPLVVFAIAIPEIGSWRTFETPAFLSGADPASASAGSPWAIRASHTAGDLGFDPFGLKPKDPAEFKKMQTKELNNGRLAMVAAAGMIVQELVTGSKLF
jgi:hypothetical protein